MKFFAKYNKQFDVLLVSFNISEVNKIESKKDIYLLYNDTSLIGVNIFNPKINKTVDYLLEDIRLQKYIQSELKQIIKIDKIDKQFIICKVVSCQPIENTHLSLCNIFDGKNKLQIICGAKNVRVNMLTVLATIGSFMPNGMIISQGKLKGYDSFGMLCNVRELEIQNNKLNQEGILDLKIDETNIGKSIWEVI